MQAPRTWGAQQTRSVCEGQLKIDLVVLAQYTGRVRIPLIAALLLSAPVWASPPVAPAKATKAEPKVEPKADPKPVQRKTEAPKLERHVETKKADVAPSTLSLKKKPSHRVMLADWAP